MMKVLPLIILYIIKNPNKTKAVSGFSCPHSCFNKYWPKTLKTQLLMQTSHYLKYAYITGNFPGIDIKEIQKMCGIWAIVNRSKLTPQQLASYQTIQPRGPDHSVIHLSPSNMIGFHRLAIIDVTQKGDQPFFHVDDQYKYTLICNGEIYNHSQLRQKFNIQTGTNNDCSVILPLFIKLNEDFQALNREMLGEYAVFITKQHKKSGNVDYFLATDPLSVRPVFYFSTQTQFGIASLLSGLCNFNQNIQRLDQGTLIHGKYTPNNNKNEILLKKKYTSQPQVSYNDENIELYREIVNTFKAAVKSRLLSDRPIGCLLSEGLDSSLVASVAAHLLKQQGKRLRTFSIGMKEGTDIVFAREVAAHIDSDHTEYIYQPQQGLDHLQDVMEVTETFDITTIRASVGQYLLAKRISTLTNVTVILNGDGADECQMGYLYFYLAPNAEQAKRDRDRLVQQIHLYDGLRVDRNIAHFGLEARVPFLDQRFVDLFYKIDPNLLVPTQERMEKYLIRRAFEVVWPQVLPKSVLWRKKEAFSDGVSSKEKSWYQMVKGFVQTKLYPKLLGIDKEITQLVQLDEKFEGLQPVCAESQFYRLYHSQKFNKNSKMFSHYWLPSWAGTNEPSARVLRVYNESKTKYP